ncbi:MAG TPA: hypothetical protein VFY98_04125 [Intrasporangium sp.]|nr:hypothetical protein [Intrasporangium sp.]
MEGAHCAAIRLIRPIHQLSAHVVTEQLGLSGPAMLHLLSGKGGLTAARDARSTPGTPAPLGGRTVGSELRRHTASRNAERHRQA